MSKVECSGRGSPHTYNSPVMSRDHQMAALYSGQRDLESNKLPDLLHICNSPNESVHVPPLLRDLPWNLIGPHRIIIWLFAKSKIVSQVDQGQGDTEPHAEQGQHGGERNLEP